MMHEKPLVSVLTTAYNRERYLGEALESVLSLTYPNVEVIVVDDASTDGSFAVAQHFAESDSRVRVFRNQENLGDYPNRNRAAALARGKYLKYVDSDDVIYPYALDAMVEAMERFPSAALGMSDIPARPEAPFPVQLSPEEVYREYYLEGEDIFGHGPLAAIIRTAAFQEVGGFSGVNLVGDLELWVKLAARYPVVLLPPGLTWWRQHEGQEYVQGIAAGVYPRLAYRVNVEALTSPHCPMEGGAREEALARVRRMQARTVVGLLRRGYVTEAARLYRAGSTTPGRLLAAVLPRRSRRNGRS
jgi:glycosyltransferase involved in cell wall biosynthesis